jgi:Putative effector of murein hydrolase LrgA
MIRGLLMLMLFQGLGELISTGFSLTVPGPVIGMACLLLVLLLREKIDTDLATVAASFSQHLGLLFVPAAVGVVSFLPVLNTHGWAVALVLLLSVAITIVTTALVLRFLSPETAVAESSQGSGKAKSLKGR